MFMFLDLKSHEGTIFFGGSGKGKIIVDGLKYNLLGISQFSDSEYVISFNKDTCIVKKKDDKILFTTQRNENFYRINLKGLSNKKVTCLMSKDNEKCIWHKKLRCTNLKHISKHHKKVLVKILLEISCKIHLLCDAFQKGKRIKSSFKSKNVVFTSFKEIICLDLEEL
ncbi:hypothetical protein CR513_48292, partial [Mucuna pruriens]